MSDEPVPPDPPAPLPVRLDSDLRNALISACEDVACRAGQPPQDRDEPRAFRLGLRTVKGGMTGEVIRLGQGFPRAPDANRTAEPEAPRQRPGL
jgi:hypothetical protein